MSRASIVVTSSRPTLVDYIFLLVGGSLSLYLLSLSPLLVKPATNASSSALHTFIAFLPAAMRLPEGIVLMGPIFYVMQLTRRRGWGLTSLEWLWVINGLGVAVLSGLAAWDRLGTLPHSMQPYATMPAKLWYLIFVPSMAALAALLGLVAMVRRAAVPWTHTFGFVLLLWPIAPLLGIISLGKFM
jgi:hypothetical protein